MNETRLLSGLPKRLGDVATEALRTAADSGWLLG
jgi:hypothetical protein